MKNRENIFYRLSDITQKMHATDGLSSPFGALFLLLVVTLVSYGLVANRLGFYWDAWPMNWIAQTRGNAGLAQYFSTNRPVWGLLYQLSTPILGASPLPWQIFGLFWRWLAAGALWAMLRLLWPRQPEPALGISLLFVIFPSFQQQSIELLYGHFFIVISAFFGSLACSLWVLRSPRRRWVGLIAGLALSAVNLLMMEYFFMLELLRPFLVWFALREEVPETRARLRHVLAAWLPYLAVFLGAVVWRAFLFPYQTNNYGLISLHQFTLQPFETVVLLAGRMISEIWTAVALSWVKAVQPMDADLFGQVNIQRYILLMLATGLILFLSVWLLGSRRKTSRSERFIWVGEGLALGVIALLLAGWPFWLTDVPFSLAFAFDRFTLPFILGGCLVLVSLIMALPWRPARWLLLAVLIGLGVGFQYQTGLAFRQDWVNQQQFFWQLHWRVPSLKPGTIIFANENKATAYSTDNSLSAPINWIYDPDNHSQNIRYLLIYPSIRLNNLNSLKLEKDVPVSEDFLVGKFTGNTSQSISVFYDGFSCLKVIDSKIDGGNPLVSNELRKTASFADAALIQPLAAGQSVKAPLPQILGSPPAGSWCQTFEEADLLRQSGQWYNITQMWERARDVYSPSQNAAEMVPFVEAFARTGQWDQATRLTVNTQKARPVLCALWQQLDQTTPATPEKKQAVKTSLEQLKCSEYGIFAGQP
jgi:hypothetical protein